MADPIYGIHQSQPIDIYNYMKANGRRLGLDGRFSYLPILKEQAELGKVIGLSDGVEMIISDDRNYYYENLMDGRTRRYAKITIFLGAFGSYLRIPQIVSIEQEMKELGYTAMEIVETLDTPSEFLARTGLPEAYINPVLLNQADLVQIKAGVPTYMGTAGFAQDAPQDGQEYVRVDGNWVVADHFVHADIDGGEATL